MDDTITEFLKEFYKDKHINIFDLVDELESKLAIKFPDKDSEIKVMLTVLGNDIMRPFGSQNVILDKKKFVELKEKLTKNAEYSEEQVSEAIITWAEVFGADIRLKIKKKKPDKSKSIKTTEPKDSIKRPKQTPWLKRRLFRRIAFSLGLITVIAVAFSYREFLSNNFVDLWNGLFAQKNLTYNSEPNESVDNTEVAQTQDTSEHSDSVYSVKVPQTQRTKAADVSSKSSEQTMKKKDSDEGANSPTDNSTSRSENTAIVQWTQEDIIRELVEITSPLELVKKLKEYGEGKYHIIVVGSREQVGSSEKDYVFIYDSKKVHGVFQNLNSSFVQIKADMSYDDLKANQPDTREVWIHFVKSQGRY